jgi:hypothetical protein
VRDFEIGEKEKQWREDRISIDVWVFVKLDLGSMRRAEAVLYLKLRMRQQRNG